MKMNRRDWLTGATTFLGSARLPFILSGIGSEFLHAQSTGGATVHKPANLLASTFTSDLLSKSLLSASDWHPYPKASERGPWQQVDQQAAESTVAQAEKIRGTPWESLPATLFLEYKLSGNRSHYEHHFFARRVRLMQLVLGECIQGQGRFLDDIVNGVWLECEETFWGLPAHLSLQKNHPGSGLPDVDEPIVDLFAADAGAVMSWIHYLLGPQLDQINPMITKRIEAEVHRRILVPALERNDFIWMFKEYEGKTHRLNNWTPWIGSNWLTAALLLENDPEKRKATILKICRSVDQYLDEYSPDACCQEGPGYWNVSPGSYFDCCTLLTSATGGAGNPLTNPFVRKMFRYIADVHISGEWFVDYGDAPPKMEESGEFLYRVGTAVDDKTLQAYGAFNASNAAARKEQVTDDQGHLGRVFPALLVTSQAINAPKNDALVRDSWYPDLGLMTARVKEGSAEGLYLAMQAAPNQRPHGHNDSGSFIVFRDGNPLFIDIGPEAYTAPRYKFSVQSAFHNLPTIGEVMQSNTKPTYRATDLHYTADDARASVSCNLATAYPPEAHLDRWERTLTLDRKANRIEIREKFRLHTKASVQLSLMTGCVPTKGGDGEIIFTPTEQASHATSIMFDPKAITPVIEKIDLTDDWLVSRWGKTIYRVLLKSAAPVDAGDWKLVIS